MNGIDPDATPTAILLRMEKKIARIETVLVGYDGTGGLVLDVRAIDERTKTVLEDYEDRIRVLEAAKAEEVGRRRSLAGILAVVAATVAAAVSVALDAIFRRLP